MRQSEKYGKICLSETPFIRKKRTHGGENMVMPNEIHIEIRVGTSGYSYEDWRNVFYPPQMPKSRFLEFYAQYFNAVEINSTYYAVPSPFTVERLVQKTPSEFCFVVKAHQEITHKRQEYLPVATKMLEALQPMIEARKFHGILAQFPYSFKNTEANRRYLLQLREVFGNFPLFVEFRHISWARKPLYAFLKENQIGYVNVDEPALQGLLPPQAVATTPFAYVRFHGRNAEHWWDGDVVSRYDYEYTEAELKEWLPNIAQLVQNSRRTYLFFNNHPKAQAIRNARQMLALLKDQLSFPH
jgi:uncharacterized protein YecE (DUF72 family)